MRADGKWAGGESIGRADSCAERASIERERCSFVDISQVDRGVGKVVRQLERRVVAVRAAGAGEQLGREIAQALELLRLAKGSVAAGGGEGDGPGVVDVEGERCACARVRAVRGLDFAACPQNNNAALGRRQLQHAVKRNGFGTVQQVEARAAKTLVLWKRNGAGKALPRMLVD